MVPVLRGPDGPHPGVRMSIATFRRNRLSEELEA